MRVEPITALDDPRLEDYRDLPDAARRRDRGVFVAESQLVVRTLVTTARFRVRSLLLTPAAFAALRADLEAAALDAPLYLVPEATIHAVVGFRFHRGCLAVAERGPALPFPAVVAGLGTGPACVVVCERLSNPDNVGGVFRNAAAFGAGAVLLAPGCCDPLYRKAVRVSMGGALRTPFATVPAWPADLARVRAAGFTVVALAPDRGAADIATLGCPPRVALLVGPEAEGLSVAARALADVTVRIPMVAGVDSLNAATACGIALHHLSPAVRASHDAGRAC